MQNRRQYDSPMHASIVSMSEKVTRLLFDFKLDVPSPIVLMIHLLSTIVLHQHSIDHSRALLQTSSKQQTTLCKLNVLLYLTPVRNWTRTPTSLCDKKEFRNGTAYARDGILRYASRATGWCTTSEHLCPSSRELTTVSQTLHWSRSQDSRKPRNSTASRSADARLDPPVIVDPGYTPTVPEQSINSTLAIDDSRSRLSRALDVLPHFGTILITSRLSQGACSNTFAPASSYTSGGKAALPLRIDAEPGPARFVEVTERLQEFLLHQQWILVFLQPSRTSATDLDLWRKKVQTHVTRVEKIMRCGAPVVAVVTTCIIRLRSSALISLRSGPQYTRNQPLVFHSSDIFDSIRLTGLPIITPADDDPEQDPSTRSLTVRTPPGSLMSALITDSLPTLGNFDTEPRDVRGL
uniref:Uncharacterized protein n=1 Tax=Anopheles melas TaxID=34690 RepID=A0A182TGH0_9DIPT